MYFDIGEVLQNPQFNHFQKCKALMTIFKHELGGIDDEM